LKPELGIENTRTLQLATLAVANCPSAIGWRSEVSNA
jgi:hypothetical protein